MKFVFLPAAALVASLLTGCAMIPDLPAPRSPTDAAKLGLAGSATRVDAQWWRALGDEQLDRLVAQALAGNPSLRLTVARLDRARAVTDAADAALLPQVNGALDLSRQLYTQQGLIPRPIAGTVRNTGTVQAAIALTVSAVVLAP
jgi:outer membrane protein TolC